MTSTITEVKRASNQANAQKSTGPRTPEGKEASKFNGITHGLSSALVVLPCEDQNEYNKQFTAFMEEYTPVSPTEEALVKQIADSQWKLRRLEKLEQRVFAKLIEQGSTGTQDPFEAMANSLLAPGKGGNVLGLLARYQGTLNRQFHQSVKELRRIQKDRVNEYCVKLKRDALNLISGRTDRSQEENLAFHLMAQDSGCIPRLLDTENDIAALEMKRNRKVG